ncbi:hypothetical protein ACPPVO_44445 [Dactylosporangium sp. McL0621]|uniref:hypothetical protein n=1 Tax=Dactylosporangium sp. McL0621 TaxID=3415678 RepID=UPI003CF31FE3
MALLAAATIMPAQAVATAGEASIWLDGPQLSPAPAGLQPVQPDSHKPMWLPAQPDSHKPMWIASA